MGSVGCWRDEAPLQTSDVRDGRLEHISVDDHRDSRARRPATLPTSFHVAALGVEGKVVVVSVVVSLVDPVVVVRVEVLLRCAGRTRQTGPQTELAGRSQLANSSPM